MELLYSCKTSWRNGMSVVYSLLLEIVLQSPWTLINGW